MTRPTTAMVATNGAGPSAEGLTPKQGRFVQEYLVDLNATQAAIRAGYSRRTARFIGCENLTKPNIGAAVSRAQASLAERTHVAQDYVIHGLLCIVESRLDDPSPAQAAVATRALELLGKHLGMFNDHARPTVTHDVSDAALQAYDLETLRAMALERSPRGVSGL